MDQGNKEKYDDFKTFDKDVMRVIYEGLSDFPIFTRFGALWMPEYARIRYSLLYFDWFLYDKDLRHERVKG